eukprot:5449665-Prymnesium_polylepis.1
MKVRWRRRGRPHELHFASRCVLTAALPHRTAPGAFKASDFSLSKEPGLEARIADSEALAKALGAAADGVELLIARAIEVTEQRCRHELQQAVDAATASAIRTTEQRMMGEREKAVEQAVGETRSEANSKQTAAVRKAIQDTETRCAEEQRVAVQLAKSA